MALAAQDSGAGAILSEDEIDDNAAGLSRPFKIPGGNFGMWLVGVVGFLGALVSGFLSFNPPSQIGTGNASIYIGFLVIGTLVEIAIPFIVFAFRKPSWKDPNSDFEPFEWETKNFRPAPGVPIPVLPAAAGAA